MKISVRFELDAAGRPTKKLTLPLPQPASVAGFTATHNADNQIAGVPYDADGNLQSTYLPLSWFPVAEMAWDTRNRLSQIWEEVWDGEAFVGYYQSQFVYDAEGHRTHQTNGGQTTRYTVNPHGLSGLSEVLIEHKPNNTQRRYLWGGPAGLLYEIQTDSSGAETNVRYYHSDQAGSTLALTDSAGEVTGRAEYTPYGVISHTSGVMDTPYLFNGAYGVQTDFQTGLIHMRARYYHPWLGRFISEDPIQFEGGNNWYAFANGDPIRMFDPMGLDAWTSFTGGLRMIGGGIETALGYTLATASVAFGVSTSWSGVGIVAGGAGAVGGAAVGAHGLDTFQAGFRQFLTGEHVNSFTSTGLQAAGMSPTAANITDAGIGVVGSLGAGLTTATVRLATIRATDSLAQGLNRAQILSQWETGAVALNSVDYAALGGASTSPLFKAPYIAAGINAAGAPLTTTATQAFFTSIRLAPTGLTPKAALGAGYTGASLFGASAANAYFNYGNGRK